MSMIDLASLFWIIVNINVYHCSTVHCPPLDVYSKCEKRWSNPEVIKHFSCLAQLRMKFILLTIVGILTFISRINTISDHSKAGNLDNFQHFISRINTISDHSKARNLVLKHFNFYKQWKFHAKMSWASKKFYNLGASPAVCPTIALSTFGY